MPSLETVECSNHEILIFSTPLSNVLDGQACLLSARPDSYQSQSSSSLTHPLGRNPWQGPCDNSIQQSMFSQYGSSQAEEFQVSKHRQLSHLSLLEIGGYSQLAHSAFAQGPHKPVSVLRKLVIQTEFQDCFTFIPCLFQSQPSWRFYRHLLLTHAACSPTPSSVWPVPEPGLPGQFILWLPNTVWHTEFHAWRM